MLAPVARPDLHPAEFTCHIKHLPQVFGEQGIKAVRFSNVHQVFFRFQRSYLLIKFIYHQLQRLVQEQIQAGSISARGDVVYSLIVN